MGGVGGRSPLAGDGSKREVSEREGSKGDGSDSTLSRREEPASGRLLIQEEVTLDEFVDERAHAVVARARALEDCFDVGAITESHGGTGRINGELLGEVAGELGFVGEQETLEFADVGKLPAVGHFAAGIDGEGLMKDEFLATVTETFFRWRPVARRAVAVAPACAQPPLPRPRQQLASVP